MKSKLLVLLFVAVLPLQPLRANPMTDCIRTVRSWLMPKPTPTQTLEKLMEQFGFDRQSELVDEIHRKVRGCLRQVSDSELFLGIQKMSFYRNESFTDLTHGFDDEALITVGTDGPDRKSRLVDLYLRGIKDGDQGRFFFRYLWETKSGENPFKDKFSLAGQPEEIQKNKFLTAFGQYLIEASEGKAFKRENLLPGFAFFPSEDGHLLRVFGPSHSLAPTPPALLNNLRGVSTKPESFRLSSVMYSGSVFWADVRP